MTWKEAFEAHPGLRAYAREQFVGNECDSDEYGETQPAKGFSYIADWFESLRPNYPEEDVLREIITWVEALADEPGGRYAGAEQLQPVLARYFDFLMESGQHPYEHTPEELLSWYLEDKES